MGKDELRLAQDLWEEIRASLSMCRDIGDFSPADFEFSDVPRFMLHKKPVFPFLLLERLKELKLEINEVFWNAYEALAFGVAKSLCYKGNMAVAFADALTCMRTHMVGGNHTDAEQCIAQEFFLSKTPLEFE